MTSARIITQVSRGVMAAIALGAAVALTGCTATPQAPLTPSATVAPALGAGVGTLDIAAASKYSWRVSSTSKYVNGSVDVCDLSLPIVIEDASVAAGPGTDFPQYSMTLRAGQISYGTVWPTQQPGTGILTGEGDYSVAYDTGGLPISAKGATTIVWRDPAKAPITSKRSDTVAVTFTQMPRSEQCSY